VIKAREVLNQEEGHHPGEKVVNIFLGGEEVLHRQMAQKKVMALLVRQKGKDDEGL
jgi:hypothetical protein